MPDYSAYQEVRESEYEELFNNSLKVAASSPYTKVVDLKGAKGLVVFQKSTTVNTTARTETSGEGWASRANVIDDNLSSATNEIYCVVGFSGGSATYGEIVIDFGSIAVRDIKSKANARIQCNSSGSGSSNVVVNIDYSEDDITYSGGGQVAFMNGGNSKNANITTTRTDLAVSMRYARIFTSGVGGSCDGHATAYEVWHAGTGLGTGQLSFEVLNELTGVWETYDIGLGTLAVMSSAGADQTATNRSGVTDTEIRNFPKGPGKIRAKYVITDGSDAQCGILKVFE